MGENLLAMWAASRGITANRVQRDMTGWDFLLEFPLPHSPESAWVPLDLQPKPIRGFLQVKATDDRKGRIPVKLDNWVRFATESIPAFFLVLEFDGMPTCQRAYLVHIDEDLIGRVLKRLRETSARTDPAPMRKQTLSFTYTDADQLPSPDGGALEAAIRRHVGSDPSRYERQKREWIDRVGYEDGMGELNVNMVLPREDPEGHLVDFALGRVEELELQQGEFRDVRFGIPAPEPIARFAEGSVLRIAPVAQDTVLRFRWTMGKQARMTASVYSPQRIAGLVRPDALKFRIANPFVDIVATLTEEPEAQILLAVPELDDPLPISALNDYAGFLLLHRDAALVPDSWIDLRFTLGSAPDHPLHLKMPGMPVAPHFIPWAEGVQKAWLACQAFGVQEDALVTRRQILSQADALEGMSAALRGDLVASCFTICTPSPFPATGSDFCVPLVHVVELGEHRMVVPVAYFGPAKPLGALEPGKECHHMRPVRLEVGTEVLLRADAPFDPQSLVPLLESTAAAWSDRHTVWRWWDG